MRAAEGRELSGTDDDTMKAVWERVLLNRRTGGWVLLSPGSSASCTLFRAFQPAGPWTGSISRFPLTGLVIPVILLVIGILLLKRSRKG